MNNTKRRRRVSRPVRRDAQGRFLECGNRNGRPENVKVDPALPLSRRRMIASSVDRIIPLVHKGRNGEPDVIEEMSIFEAAIYRLGTMAAQGNRVAAQFVIQLALENSNAVQSLVRYEEHLARKRGNPVNLMSDDELMASVRQSRALMANDAGDDEDDFSDEPDFLDE